MWGQAQWMHFGSGAKELQHTVPLLLEPASLQLTFMAKVLIARTIGMLRCFKPPVRVFLATAYNIQGV